MVDVALSPLSPYHQILYHLIIYHPVISIYILMNNVSRKKITVGYVLLLAMLLFSLFFVRREMENLAGADNSDLLRTDSLIRLLREKDANTVRLLRTLSEANDSMISARAVEQIIAEQDTVVVQHRVQRRVTARRDTVVTQPRKKGFFRRLGEVFVPPRKDSAVQVQTTLEVATDTVLDAYNPADSLQAKLRIVARQRKEASSVMQRRKRNLQRLDHALSERIDSLLKGYEQGALLRARAEAERQKAVRKRSATIIGGIAAGAVALSALFLVLIGRDVTRSNRYRRELEEANRFAEELLATREKLMLAITHDFKAPLGSIMGYADLLAKSAVDDRQRSYLDNMKGSSEHLLKLVTDLLDFHRLDLKKAEVNRVTFHPARLMEEIRVSFQPLASAKGLSLTCRTAPVLKGSFVSDPLRLRQIVSNLLSNAVKFTDRGGITLTADFVQGGDRSFAGSHLRLSVADTGRGMEPADCERIFQEFTRLPGAQGEEGFGLGLSIVRMLVQLLEGKIEVKSRLDEGSTFTVRLPLYPVGELRTGEEAEEAVEGEGEELQGGDAVQPGSLSGAKSLPVRSVLLIDDDRIQLTLTAAMLSQSGISAVSCLQLDELLEALRTGSFDVLLTDVQMPAMNGFDLLRLLRASNIGQARSIPVIAVTARSDMRREDFLKHGFAGSLHKPFTVGELLEQLGATPSAVDFSALTAFSADDPEAAQSILRSFVAETRLNARRLQESLEAEDADGVAAMAHKMLPLFTLLGEGRLVTLLKEPEAARGKTFDAGLRQKSLAALARIAEVTSQAEAW